MIDISAIAFVNTSGLLHESASCVPFGATFKLGRGSLVIPVFFGVVSCCWHGCGVLYLVAVLGWGWSGVEGFLKAVARVDGAIHPFAGHGKDNVGIDGDAVVVPYDMDSASRIRFIHPVSHSIFQAFIHKAEYFVFIGELP
jgi:hypothetical protein